MKWEWFNFMQGLITQLRNKDKKEGTVAKKGQVVNIFCTWEITRREQRGCKQLLGAIKIGNSYYLTEKITGA